jgi:hypothetical protein
MQTGYLAGTWFAGSQGGRQALALHADRVAGRHMHCIQTGLQTSIWTADREPRTRRHAVWQAKRVADRRPASRQGSRTASRQVGMPAHRFRAVVAGRQSDLQAGRQTGRQALELQVGKWQTVGRYGGSQARRLGDRQGNRQTP